MKIKDYWGLIKETFAEWREDKASRLAAALSYYTIFSLAPLLVIVIAIAGLVFGADAARGAIVDQLGGLVGIEGAAQIETMIENAGRSDSGVVATIIGVVVLILGASGVFGQLQESMNTIWEVKPKPGRGLLGMIRSRFLSFSMVLGVAFLLLVSLVVTAGLAAMGNWMLNAVPGFEVLIQILNFVISFVVITFLFVLIFKFLPDAEIAWKDVWLGAAVTSLLFTIGKMAIGIYLGNSDATSVFGAAGSLIVLLLWVYYSGQILFLGAEFTQVYANKYGSKIQPNEDAERVIEEDRAQQGMTRNNAPEHPTGGPHQAGVPVFRPEPVTGVATAVPSLASIPVPVTRTDVDLSERLPDNTVARVVESGWPAVIALVIGLGGSLLIAREQRSRPLQQRK